MSETNPTLVGRVPGFSQEYPTLELAIADSMRDGEHAIFTIQTGDEVEVKLENGAVQYVTVSKKRLEGIVREAGMLAVMLRVVRVVVAPRSLDRSSTHSRLTLGSFSEDRISCDLCPPNVCTVSFGRLTARSGSLTAKPTSWCNARTEIRASSSHTNRMSFTCKLSTT